MKEARLGTVLNLLIDHRGKTPKKLGGDFTDQGVRVVSAIHIKNGRINWDERYRYVSEEMFERWMPQKTRQGDVLLTSEAPLGEVTQVPDDGPLVLSQRLFALRGKAGVLDSGYLRYFLQSPLGRRRLLANESGSTVSGIQQARLREVLVPLPPFADQQRIAGVLGAFDDLIEANRKLAQSQESLARALASRGGDEVALHEIAAVPKLRQRRPAGLVDHFSIPAFDDGLLPAHDLSSTILSGKYVLSQPSVLVSRLNPSTPRTWMAYPGINEAVCSTEFVVLTGHSGVSTEEVWAVTSSDDFWMQMESSVGGTTNSRQRVDKALVPEMMVPDVRLLPAVEREAITTLVCGAYELRVEAAGLAAHRDELLPLLMSGKVRVSDLEGVAQP